jgi:Flp pilus assembly protein TadD
MAVCGLMLSGCAAQNAPAVNAVDEARALMAKGDSSSALRILRRHLQETPDDVAANFLAGSLLARSDPRAAKDHLSLVPEESQHYPSALRLLAAGSLQSNDVEAAAGYLAELHALLPGKCPAVDSCG